MFIICNIQTYIFTVPCDISSDCPDHPFNICALYTRFANTIVFYFLLDKGNKSDSPRSRKRSESGCDIDSSPPADEFISDTFSGAHVDQEALQRDMQLLGMNNEVKANEPTTDRTKGKRGGRVVVKW